MTPPPAHQTLPTEAWTTELFPPPRTSDALTQIGDFLQTLGYNKTFKALAKEAEHKGAPLDYSRWPASVDGPLGQSLSDLYIDAYLEDAEDTSASESEKEDSPVRVNEEAESTSDGESDREDASNGTHAPPMGIKRKRELTPSTSSGTDTNSEDESGSEAVSSDGSSSTDSSESSESENEAPPLKKAKFERRVHAGSDSSDDSSSASSDSDSSKSSVNSDSDNDDNDGDDASANDSESDSDSDSSSETSDQDDTSSTPTPVRSTQRLAAVKDGKAKRSADSSQTSAASSATLGASPQPTGSVSQPEDVAATLVHPSRLNRVDGAAQQAAEHRASKGNVPFSRIPKNTVVDPRFSSNDYVPYDYANKAWQDLSVTRGKGFTKEKNKKKRGSYRGGAIDLAPKGIKFED